MAGTSQPTRTKRAPASQYVLAAAFGIGATNAVAILVGLGVLMLADVALRYLIIKRRAS